MIQGIMTREWMGKWKIVSPEEYGFHKVIVSGRGDCQAAAMYRLDLTAGQRYELMPGGKEMNGVCIREEAGLGLAGRHYHCGRFDSLYMAEGNSVAVGAEADCIFYIGAFVDEGYGTPSFRASNPRLPSDEVHQAHGKGTGQREVFMTLSQEIQVSCLVAGLTWGDNSAWTSWPSHQREADLEEIYRYFGTDEPHFGLHLSYTASGDVDNIVAHPVESESMVLAPKGYRPIVTPPGTRDTYFWVLVAHSYGGCSCDLAVLDPRWGQIN